MQLCRSKCQTCRKVLELGFFPQPVFPCSWTRGRSSIEHSSGAFVFHCFLRLKCKRALEKNIITCYHEPAYPINRKQELQRRKCRQAVFVGELGAGNTFSTWIIYAGQVCSNAQALPSVRSLKIICPNKNIEEGTGGHPFASFIKDRATLEQAKTKVIIGDLVVQLK